MIDRILSLLAVLVIPLMLFHSLGGIVIGIWLLVIGFWQPVLAGLVIPFLGSFALGVAFLLLIPVGVPAAFFSAKGWRFMAMMASVPVTLITNLILGAWAYVILTQYYPRFASPDNFELLLIFSYFVMISPISYMASKEPAGQMAGHHLFSIFGLQISYWIILLSIFFGNVTFAESMGRGLICLVGFTLVSVVINATVAYTSPSDREIYGA